MAKPKQSEAFRITKYFRDSSIEIAELTYALVRETMAERRSMTGPIPSGFVKKRKRGPNKLKTLSASAPLVSTILENN